MSQWTKQEARYLRQVTLKRLMDSNSVDVGVVDEPDDLIREELRVVLRVEVCQRRARVSSIPVRGGGDEEAYKAR